MTGPNAEVTVNVRIEGKTGNNIRRYHPDDRQECDHYCRRNERYELRQRNEWEQVPRVFQVPTCTSALADTATGVGTRPRWGA